MTAERQTTVCMCTFNRPQNLAALLPALAAQRPRVIVWVWNNGEPLAADLRGHIDWLIEPRKNCLCPPRWWLAARAETPIVCILDDDLMPAHPGAFRELVAHCRPGLIVGPYGAIVRDLYRRHLRVNKPLCRMPVDVIKGRCMAMHTDTLRAAIGRSGVLLARSILSEYEDLCIAEDIAVCGAVAGGKRLHHLVPAGLGDDWKDLPEGPESLSRRADHMCRRDRVFARAFP